MGKYVATAALIVCVGIVVFSGDGGFSVKDGKLVAERMDPDLIMDTISHGARVEIEDHLIAGRWTVIEFTADW